MPHNITKESLNESLKAYTSLLKTRGCQTGALYKRRHLANMLATFVTEFHEMPINQAFRFAVDAVLNSLSDEDSRNTAVSVAREVYPFIIQDFKSIANMVSTGGYSGQTIKAVVASYQSFNEMLDGIQHHPLDQSESSILQSYIDALNTSGATNDVTTMRSSMATALMIELRKTGEISGLKYRAVIDSILPICKLETTQYYFLAMSREFFYFLTKSEDAISKVALEFNVAAPDH